MKEILKKYLPKNDSSNELLSIENFEKPTQKKS